MRKQWDKILKWSSKITLDSDKLLTSCAELANEESIDSLLARGIVLICEQFSADYGKIIIRNPTEKNRTTFLVGYCKNDIKYWSKERTKICDVEISSLKEQKEISRDKRSLVGDVLATGNFHFVEDVNTYIHSDFNLAIEPNVISEIVAPINSKNKVINFALCLSFKMTVQFDQNVKSQVKKFCTLLGALLERLIEYNYNIRVSDFQNSLLKIVENNLDENPYIYLSKAIKNRFGSEECSIYLFSPDYDKLVLVGTSGQNNKSILKNETWGLVADYITQDQIKHFFYGSPEISVFKLEKILFLSIYDPIADDRVKIGFVQIVFSCEFGEPNNPCFSFDTFSNASSEYNGKIFHEISETIKSVLLNRQTRIINEMRKSLRSMNFEDFLSDPVQALQCVIDKMPYSPIRLWKYSRDENALFLDLPVDQRRANNDDIRKIIIEEKMKTLVTEVFLRKQIIAKYGKLNESVKFPDVVPCGEISWLGYPIYLNESDDTPFAVLSVFQDPSKRKNEIFITIVDEPIINLLAIFISLFERLHKAYEERMGRQAVLSHELTALLQLIASDEGVLYQRLLNTDVLKDKGKGNLIVAKHVLGRTFVPRTNALIHKNIQTCMEGIGLELRREEFVSGGWKPEFTDWQIHPILSEIVALVRSMLSRRSWLGKKLNIKYHDFSGFVVSCDKSALMRALLNIIVNAVKYGDDHTDVEIYPDPNNMIVIANKGIEIPEGEEDLIFLRQIQGSNARTASKKFSSPGEETFSDQGLGLFVARSIMRTMDGDVLLVNPGRHGELTKFAIQFSSKKIRKWENV